MNGMEQFEGFEKLKKMKNGNRMEWEKWIRQTRGQLFNIRRTNSNIIIFNCKTIFYIFIVELKDEKSVHGINDHQLKYVSITIYI